MTFQSFNDGYRFNSGLGGIESLGTQAFRLINTQWALAKSPSGGGATVMGLTASGSTASGTTVSNYIVSRATTNGTGPGTLIGVAGFPLGYLLANNLNCMIVDVLGCDLGGGIVVAQRRAVRPILASDPYYADFLGVQTTMPDIGNMAGTYTVEIVVDVAGPSGFYRVMVNDSGNAVNWVIRSVAFPILTA